MEKIKLKTILYSEGYNNRVIKINDKEIVKANCYEEFSFDEVVYFIRNALEALDIDYDSLELKLQKHPKKQRFSGNRFDYNFSDMLIAIKSTLDILNIDYNHVAEYKDYYQDDR